MNEQLTKLFRQAVTYGFGRILGKVISFLLIPFYTHYFTTTEYGIMEVLNLTAMIATVLLAPGLSTAVMRFYYDTENPEEQKAVISTSLIFTCVVGGVISLTAILFPDWPTRLLLGNLQHRQLLQLVAAAFFFSFTADIGWVYLRCKQRSGFYTFLSQSFLIATIALNVYLIGVRKLGVAGSFWANVVVGGIVWIILFAMTIREVGLRVSLPKAWQLLRFGAPLFTVWLAAFVLNYSDRFFLQRFHGIEAVGIYAVGYKFAYIISLLIVQPFQLMWEPQSYEISKRDNAPALFSQVFALYSVALIAVAFLLSLSIHEIFDLMVDPKFASACQYVSLIAFAYVVQGMGLYFEAGLLIRKKNLLLSTIGAVSTVICLLLNSVLIYFGAAWGAAWATFFSFAFLALATYVFSARAYPFSMHANVIVKVIALSALLLAGGYLMAGEPLIVRLPIKFLLAGMFFIVLIKLRVLPEGLIGLLRREAMGWSRARLSPIFAWVDGLVRGEG